MDSHNMHNMHMTANDESFSTDITGLAPTTATDIVDLADGATFDLVAAPVRKQIGDAELRMLAYNGSVPGPTLRVQQGSTITINFTNQTDLESTVHWHGLRLDNRFDGTHETQAPVAVGESFSYQITFPDQGVYWYHPHIREDYGQEMGLYGNILVVPAQADYWPPVHRELLLTLDDILIEDGAMASFSRTETTFSAMGRYGNVLLINGEIEPEFTAQTGEVVRLYLTNTANARVFNVAVPGARIKLVGGDSGRVEQETFVESVIISPSERAVIDVLFEQAGPVTIEHETPEKRSTLATVKVSAEPVSEQLAAPFDVLRRNPEWTAERERFAPYFGAEPDKTLSIIAEMQMDDEGATSYACPMHPEVTSDSPGRCPKCGMKLLPVAAINEASGQDMHAQHGHMDHGSHMDHSAHMDPGQHGHMDHGEHAGHGQMHDGHHADAADGIEWEDDMVDVNRITTPANTRWKFIDTATGAANHAIDWRFRVGDLVKIRLINEMDSDHPMHHPFHIHGAGRFVVLARDGADEQNLVWKDTVLVRTGQTVDILLEVTNPGTWMAHCHIAEHHESGMMFSFTVDS
jgi:FtsP/CotA-like multicopper oxidase with cupredoxin domain